MGWPTLHLDRSVHRKLRDACALLGIRTRTGKPRGGARRSTTACAWARLAAWKSSYRLGAHPTAPSQRCCLATLLWRTAQSIFPQVYLLQDCGVYVLLGFTFARTLSCPAELPLYAVEGHSRLHGPLPPQVARYTRSTTAAWALFFALITLTSLILFQFAPLTVWSAFVNFFTLPLVVLMFVGEYAVRRRTLPPAHRTGLLESVRVYFNSSRYSAVQRQ